MTCEGLAALMQPLIDDGRIGPVHICVYLALVQIKADRGLNAAFPIRKEEVMRLAKIQGRTTYYRVMNDLDRWGYLTYRPSFSGRGENEVMVG